MKKILALLFFLAAPSFAGVWDATTPAGTDPINQGDDRIREMKTAIAEALNRTSSGVFPGTNPATAPMFQWTLQQGLQSARPTANLQDGQLYFSTNTGTTDRYNSTTSQWYTVGIGSNTTSQIVTSSNVTVGGSLTVSGSVSLPTTTKIHAYVTDGTAINGKLIASNETIDTGSEWNVTFGSFTATNAGYYLVYYQLEFDGSIVAASDDGMLISINSAPASATLAESYFFGVDSGAAVGFHTMSVMKLLQMSAGDQIEFRATEQNGFSATARSGSNGTFIDIIRVL